MRKITSLFTVLMLFVSLAYGQNRSISGTVTDENGAPVQGASVRIKGTRTGVAADNNGIFRILAKTGDVLQITGGIEAIEVTVGTDNNITVRAKRTVVAGTEVVVTALGIRRRPKELGYANTTIKADQITNGQAPRLGQALSGKAAGLTVYNTSSAVNASPRIVLRGNRSLTGDNTALIVLDGVPVPANTLNYLNPNDVETVTLLKGGQAATIYGSDGVNGALVITTKEVVVNLRSTSAVLQTLKISPTFLSSRKNSVQVRAMGQHFRKTIVHLRTSSMVTVTTVLSVQQVVNWQTVLSNHILMSLYQVSAGRFGILAFQQPMT